MAVGERVMKRILVTGGSGFIGAPTARILAERGYEVCVVCSRADFELDGAGVYRADLLERSQIDKLIDTVKPDALVHLAWIATPGVYQQSLLNLAWARESLYLLERFVLSGGSRALMVGTCFEYDLAYGHLFESITPEKPGTLYGAAKLSLSTLGRAYAAQTGISLACPRLFYLFGEREAPTRAIPYAILAALRGEPMKCQAPSAVRDYMPEIEMARALCSILESDIRGVVNVASGEGLTMREMFTFIAEQTDRKENLDFADVHTDPAVIIGDNRRLRDEVGFVRSESWQEGLIRCIEWWKKAGAGV